MIADLLELAALGVSIYAIVDNRRQRAEREKAVIAVMPSAIFQDGSSTPSRDFDWLVGRMNEDGLPISIPTGHGITLKDDHIHEYKSSSNGPGYLILTVQIYINGNRAWTVPVVGRPGTPGLM